MLKFQSYAGFAVHTAEVQSLWATPNECKNGALMQAIFYKNTVVTHTKARPSAQRISNIQIVGKNTIFWAH